MNLPPASMKLVELESTAILIDRARSGDENARDRLARRYLPSLRAFARGRLPRSARSLEETNDVVQVAMMRAFDHLENVQAERRGSFLVYLRVIVDNLIRDRLRSQVRNPRSVELPEEIEDKGRTPFDDLAAKEERERYEQVLTRLSTPQREAVILRFELDCSYETIADELALPSANAARMRVERALLRLAKQYDTRHRARER